ncbi:hypothetical protein A2115_02835 [Candidatus Woesebacteria bacterium GWA1_41_8]|uniref:Cell division protein FtsL n=1 Tax=Candidatus Woesebacteria bacterium GWA1_41_8 TaxID=1802471 RepID=A0A1F7WK14_9BACT|nr:MAG: hypothetical protein A2115_02835 [Candidatus Woesebacteria bacterium GWA1_41_8]
MKHKKEIQTAKPRSKKGIFWWLTLALFVVSVVVFTIETATSGARLAKLEKQERALVQENSELSALLVESSSLTSLETKSSEMGFGIPQKIIYIGSEEGFAKLP